MLGREIIEVLLKMPPIPHLPELMSQAASTLQTKTPGWKDGGELGEWRSDRFERGVEGVEALILTCA